MFKTNRLSLQIIASKVDWLQLVSKWFIVFFINTLSFKQVTSCSMPSIVMITTFREAVIKVEVANFGAAIDALIDQDGEECEAVHIGGTERSLKARFNS